MHRSRCKPGVSAGFSKRPHRILTCCHKVSLSLSFPPRWCRFTALLSRLQSSRWRYCTSELAAHRQPNQKKTLFIIIFAARLVWDGSSWITDTHLLYFPEDKGLSKLPTPTHGDTLILEVIILTIRCSTFIFRARNTIRIDQIHLLWNKHDRRALVFPPPRMHLLLMVFLVVPP